jgi:hypothetical protein
VRCSSVRDPLWYDLVGRCTHVVNAMRDETLLPHETEITPFTEWARAAEPKLRQALTASFGPQGGSDATADARAIAWERWDDVRQKVNPLGYVYGIGRNTARRMAGRRNPGFLDVSTAGLPHVEPGLPEAVTAAGFWKRAAAWFASIGITCDSYATRAIPPAVRRYVAWRDGGCTIDGCRSRYRLQPHHVRHRADGGGHEPDNLTTLCWYHHHVAIHVSDFRIDPHSPPQRRRLLPPSGADPPARSG